MFTVLIADDEPHIREGLTRIIRWEEHGLELTQTAENGGQALERVLQGGIDILLTDIRMPRMDGLALIAECKRRRLDMRYIILSGYDDFEYIKEAVKLGIENYLLKPVDREELSTTLINTADKLQRERSSMLAQREGLNIFRENVLYRWLAGEMPMEELQDKARVLGLGLDARLYTVAALRLLRRQAGVPLPAAANTQARDICAWLCAGAAVFTGLNGDVLALFPHEGADQRAGIAAALQRCVAEVGRALTCDAFAAIGPSVSGAAQAHESHTAAQRLLGYSLILPANSIVDHETVEREARDRARAVVVDTAALERLLHARDEAGCAALIDGAFEELTRAAVTPQHVRNTAVDMLYHMTHAVEAASGGTPLEALGIDVSEVYVLYTAQALAGWLKTVCQRALALLRRSEEAVSPHMKMILAYIHDNYNRDLSIKALSTQFNINSAYLGQLFKNTTGEMFTNYINRLRVERAKTLLRTTALKAAEISEMVGYSNTNYFYRIFKKLTGVSPTEFR